jgi:hypothetical protein
MAINSYNKVKPGLQGQLAVFVAEYLEAVGVVAGTIPRLLDRLTVQPSNKSIKRTKHHESSQTFEGLGLYRK